MAQCHRILMLTQRPSLPNQAPQTQVECYTGVPSAAHLDLERAHRRPDLYPRGLHAAGEAGAGEGASGVRTECGASQGTTMAARGCLTTVLVVYVALCANPGQIVPAFPAVTSLLRCQHAMQENVLCFAFAWYASAPQGLITRWTACARVGCLALAAPCLFSRSAGPLACSCRF